MFAAEPWRQPRLLGSIHIVKMLFTELVEVVQRGVIYEDGQGRPATSLPWRSITGRPCSMEKSGRVKNEIKYWCDQKERRSRLSQIDGEVCRSSVEMTSRREEARSEVERKG